MLTRPAMVVSVYARGTNNPGYQLAGNGGEMELKAKVSIKRHRDEPWGIPMDETR